jgi:hypothetical protein
MVIGKSGRGKSTALRHLPPDSTYIINAIGKPLPFPQGAQYETGRNVSITVDPAQIRQVMTQVSSNDQFSHLVLDDTQYIMAAEFMAKAMIRGYDKFSLMAKNMWEILLLCTRLRPSLKVYFLAHEEDNGSERKMKTLGRLLDEKITPEGLASIVLFADVQYDEQTGRKFFFSTQSDGVTNAKTPIDMFPQQIPNDLLVVSQRIDEYYKGVQLSDSKLDFQLT